MTKPAHNGLRVLIIDDEEDFALTLASRLELRGMRVTTFFSGEDGLAFLHAAPKGEFVDALLLDMRMPGLSGVEVLHKVRAAWPLLPVLIITGHCSQQDFNTAQALGVQGYHTKPIQFDELLESLASLKTSPNLATGV